MLSSKERATSVLSSMVRRYVMVLAFSRRDSKSQRRSLRRYKAARPHSSLDSPNALLLRARRWEI